MTDENAIIIQAWNTVLFEKFTRFRYLLTHGLSGHSDEAFRRQPMERGSKVLDVGCGFGDTSLRIAEMVGPSGHVTGVDCAEKFVESARTDARVAQVDNVTFELGDVQFSDLGGPYAHAFSRFGTMFFNSPGAALRNIRRALGPGGQLTMIVWRKREDNPWLHEAELCVRALVPVVSHEDAGQVHCGPGPFSMSGPDMVSDMLQGSGFGRVRFERFDTEICIGRNLDEAVEFATALGPAGEILRLAGAAAEKSQDAVADALRSVLGQFQRGDGSGVWAPSSTWFVHAYAP